MHIHRSISGVDTYTHTHTCAAVVLLGVPGAAETSWRLLSKLLHTCHFSRGTEETPQTGAWRRLSGSRPDFGLHSLGLISASRIQSSSSVWWASRLSGQSSSHSLSPLIWPLPSCRLDAVLASYRKEERKRFFVPSSLQGIHVLCIFSCRCFVL